MFDTQLNPRAAGFPLCRKTIGVLLSLMSQRFFGNCSGPLGCVSRPLPVATRLEADHKGPYRHPERRPPGHITPVHARTLRH
ncbi:hypothetical protein [Streptomyces sp. NPDC059788]|uniref:hypothetical protein n=1 Tax=Streptomyces sp. NPDC059788 TaxID=3346948 RepID=UPI003657F7E8